MTDRTPSTAAGRAMYAKWGHHNFVDEWNATILAIEDEARAPLDVERLARALFGVLGWPHRLQPLYMDGDFDNPLWAKWATDIAREYAALEEPTP